MRRLGPYEVRDAIGSGGMDEVTRAIHGDAGCDKTVTFDRRLRGALDLQLL